LRPASPIRATPARVVHRLDDILRARVFAIACGYEDADDLDALRDDPGFRLALGKLPGSGAGLASQPTMSRWENAPTTRELARMMAAMIGVYCASYPAPPTAVTLDIDDTCDVVHGYQQFSFWNGHHGERCFLPIHVYDTATGRPVAMLLRTGKTPSGAEAAGHIRRLVRHIRRYWPDTTSPSAATGTMAGPRSWPSARRPGRLTCSACRPTPRCAPIRKSSPPPMPARSSGPSARRRSCATMPRPATARRAGTASAASSPGSRPARWAWTSATSSPRWPQGSAEHIYDTLYCARGQAENLIKRHKAQLASDRTSCRSANANQMRLILHTAAYWLMWRVQQAIPKALALATAEFATLRLRLLKVAARVIETASRIRVAFASACPDANMFRALATGLRPAPT
jgi:hypothetical protein